MLDEVSQHGIGKPVFVGPLRVPEDAVEFVGVGGFNCTHTRLEGLPDVFGDLANLKPVRLCGNMEAVIFREGSKLSIAARFLERRLRLLIEDITQPFIKKKGEDELLVVSGINGPPQKRRGPPEISFELLLGDACIHEPSVAFGLTLSPRNVSTLSLMKVAREEANFQ